MSKDVSVGFADVQSISANIKKIKEKQDKKLAEQNETDEESNNKDKYVAKRFDELYSRNYSYESIF